MTSVRTTRCWSKRNAAKNNIQLVYLPPYSPDLNPIEQIWRAIKREVAATFIMNYEHLTTVIARAFEILTAKRSYWEKWVIKFLSPKYASKMLSDELYFKSRSSYCGR
ncbi:MAG: transposase [Candidatus Methanoculleus thermohydrogenotrophicum]|nr:transposase [Candidatus Methanoculleus thermohydrogenotrophicum]